MKLKEIGILPDVANLMKYNLVPPTARQYTFGLSFILIIPPYRSAGWYVAIWRKDRKVVVNDINRLCSMLLPPTVHVDAKIEIKKRENGYFHAVCTEIKNG